jgi:hypothetical protein
MAVFSLAVYLFVSYHLDCIMRRRFLRILVFDKGCICYIWSLAAGAGSVCRT